MWAICVRYQACPTALTSNTVVIPFKAPRVTTYFTQLMPTVWNATEYGAFWSILGVGTIEHKVNAMRTYKTVHIVIEPSNRMGMSCPVFCFFCHCQNCIKTQVWKEEPRCCTEDSPNAVTQKWFVVLFFCMCQTCNDDKDEDKHVDKCSNPVEIGGVLGAPDFNCSSSNEDSYGNWVKLIVARSEVGFNPKLQWILLMRVAK